MTGSQREDPAVRVVWDFRRKLGGHDDLMLYLNGKPEGPFDTYYLALDETFDREALGAEAVRAVLRRLLEAVGRCAGGGGGRRRAARVMEMAADAPRALAAGRARARRKLRGPA